MSFARVIAAAVVLSAVSAYAQQTFEPAIPRGWQDQRVEPSGELAPPATTLPPRLVQSDARPQGDADARHCLAATTNTEIHRCAERYRAKPARATVRRAPAKPAAPGSAAPPANPTR